MKVLTLDEWSANAASIFGPKIQNWRFVCPNCKQSQSLREFEDHKIQGAKDMFFFSCIGRFVKDRGCDWSLGGLLQIHETEVVSEDGKNIPVMEFAEMEVSNA